MTLSLASLYRCIISVKSSERFHEVYEDLLLCFCSYVYGTCNQLVEVVTQLTFTCSKSTVETLEKDVKYVRS